MPANVPEKVKFIAGEITSLRSRMVKQDNAVQVAKLSMLEDIQSDYQKSMDMAAARVQAERQEGGE